MAEGTEWSRTTQNQIVALLLAASGFLLAYLVLTSFGAATPDSDSARFVRTNAFFVWVLVVGAQFAY